MTREEMITALNGELDRLERVRAVLQKSKSHKFAPTGKLIQTAVAQVRKSAGKSAGEPKRVLSPEARKRIAQAQKKRWARQKAGRA
jgi:hypothetical protein